MRQFEIWSDGWKLYVELEVLTIGSHTLLTQAPKSFQGTGMSDFGERESLYYKPWGVDASLETKPMCVGDYKNKTPCIWTNYKQK